MTSFYSENPGKILRLGDVLQGTALVAPSTKDLSCSGEYDIKVFTPRYVAVLTPCCSIENKTICFCPLVRVERKYFENPYLKEDLTRINRVMKPEQALPPHAWASLENEEKQKRLEHGMTYAFLNFFVFAQHDLLESYSLSESINTNYYMIDFRHMYRVICDKIIRNQDAPGSAKVLQLSRSARDELRFKLVSYFGRTPDEDMVGMTQSIPMIG